MWEITRRLGTSRFFSPPLPQAGKAAVADESATAAAAGTKGGGGVAVRPPLTIRSEFRLLCLNLRCQSRRQILRPDVHV